MELLMEYAEKGCPVNCGQEEAWNFVYVLPVDDPATDINDIQIVVPDTLQMGCFESPPFFCTASETARDVIQELWESHTILGEHLLEQRMKFMDVQESCIGRDEYKKIRKYMCYCKE